MIDILNLQPTTISRDLKGKYVLIYSLPKMGKTTLACAFPKNLLLAFERGYNNISGAKAIDVTKWADFKLILRQLEKPEAKAMYDTITIDTVSIAWDLCEQFICSQNGVQNIGDIPWGQGYSQLTKEFENCLRKITMLGYGLVLIAHVAIRKEVVDGNELEFYSPALNKRCYPVCNRIVDIIGYINQEWDEEGNSHRYLYTRQTPRVIAGSRYKYLAPKIDFGYQQLVDAIGEAIDKQEKLDGAKIVDKQEIKQTEELNYNSIKQEAADLWQKMVGDGQTEKQQEMAKRILKRVEMIFGRPIKLSEITEDQVDLFNLVILEMKELFSQQ